MALIKATVTDQVLTITEAPEIAAGDVNEDRVLFIFDSTWTSYTKTAVFWQDEAKQYGVVIDNDGYCTIPKGAMLRHGVMHFGIIASVDGKTKTSGVVSYKLGKAANINAVVNVGSSTPDLVSQLMAYASRISNIIAHNNDTTGNSELVDIRVDAAGNTHSAAGDAVRAAENKALGNYPGTLYTGNLDSLKTHGVYVCENLTGSPFTYRNGICFVKVVSSAGSQKWVEQFFINTAQLGETAVRRYHADDNTWSDWAYTYSGSYIDNTKSLDDYKSPGTFAVCSELVPSEIVGKTTSTYGMMTVERFDGAGSNWWISQRMTIIHGHTCTAQRVGAFTISRAFYSSANSWTTWGTDNAAMMASNPDLNSYIKMTETVWVNGCTTENNCPVNGNGILSVLVCGNSSTATALVRQIFTRYNTESNIASEEYIRYISYNRATGSANYNPWRKIGSAISNKTVVCFGDSVFGNFSGADGVAENIRAKTGATVYNVAFGGTRYTDHVAKSAWKYFDFKQLMDSVCGGNFAGQDNNIAAVKEELNADLKSKYTDNLATLKTIDFSKVDYVVLAYGTNDWANNECTNAEVKAAIEYGIEKLLTKYPNIRVVVVTPTMRFMFNAQNQLVNTGDTYTVTKTGHLCDTVDTIMETAKGLRLPVVDDYYSLGWNQYNYSSFFTAPDGTHPNANGRRLLGFRIGAFLENI